MEVLYCCSAMPSVHESLGDNLAPLPADKSNWHIHQNVIVCTPWHIHQTCRLGIKLCYIVCFSLSLQSALMLAVPLLDSSQANHCQGDARISDCKQANRRSSDSRVECGGNFVLSAGSVCHGLMTHNCLHTQGTQ